MVEIRKKHESKYFLEQLRREKSFLRQKYNVKTLGLFGSAVRNEQKKNSDVDILVEFHEPIGLFKFFELEDHLKKILRRNVDLVSKKALKPRLKNRILKEVKYI